MNFKMHQLKLFQKLQILVILLNVKKCSTPIQMSQNYQNLGKILLQIEITLSKTPRQMLLMY